MDQNLIEKAFGYQPTIIKPLIRWVVHEDRLEFNRFSTFTAHGGEISPAQSTIQKEAA
jgi:hypothetical protein